MDKRLIQLKNAIAVLVPFREDAFAIVTEAGIQTVDIIIAGTPNTMWFNIIKYADDNEQVDDLVRVLLEKYPRNPHLLAFKEPIVQDYSTGPDIGKDVKWENNLSASTLQKITAEKNTLLPIRFLEIGLNAAKSVARVSIPRAGKVELGSGFLLAGNIFVTNNHVIPDEATAKLANIDFNYELSINENPYAITRFHGAPGKGFLTCKQADWTAMCLDGDANQDFMAVELQDMELKAGDFVNIIQHPAGRYKEIGMYHNVVVSGNRDIVQYLTDTEPGSSGSPVFNSDWKVVALHQSGGMLADHVVAGAKSLRNQGIHISRVAEGVAKLREKLAAPGPEPSNP